jgi:hypothetical protein
MLKCNNDEMGRHGLQRRLHAKQCSTLYMEKLQDQELPSDSCLAGESTSTACTIMAVRCLRDLLVPLPCPSEYYRDTD